MFRTSFKEVFKDSLKHINSLSKKVCFVGVVCHSSQLPEQKEGLFYSTCDVARRSQTSSWTTPGTNRSLVFGAVAINNMVTRT